MIIRQKEKAWSHLQLLHHPTREPALYCCEVTSFPKGPKGTLSHSSACPIQSQRKHAALHSQFSFRYLETMTPIEFSHPNTIGLSERIPTIWEEFNIIGSYLVSVRIAITKKTLHMT